MQKHDTAISSLWQQYCGRPLDWPRLPSLLCIREHSDDSVWDYLKLYAESHYPKFPSWKPCDILSFLFPIYKSLPSFPQPPTPASPPWPASAHSQRWNWTAAIVTLQFVCHIVTGFPHPPHSVVKALEEEERQIMKYRKAGKEEAAERQQPNWNAKNYGEVTEREAQTRNYT